MSASASSLVCLLLASFVSVGGLESDADFGSDGLVNVIVATSSKEDLADRVFVLETLLAKTTDQLTEFQIKVKSGIQVRFFSRSRGRNSIPSMMFPSNVS